jgi:hypothetical protein
MSRARRLFEVSRINQAAYCRDPVSREARSAGMLANAVLVWCEVDAVQFILGDVTVEPSDLRPHFLQRMQGTE